MKFRLNWKDKETSLETDIEQVIEKGMEQNALKPPKKTRYQIKMEEKRKCEELKHKQEMQKMYLLIGVVVGIIVIVLFFGMIAGILNTLR